MEYGHHTCGYSPKTGMPSPNSYKLSIPPWLGVEFSEHFPSSCWDIVKF